MSSDERSFSYCEIQQNKSDNLTVKIEKERWTRDVKKKSFSQGFIR